MILVDIVWLFCLDDDLECPIDYETSLLPNVFPCKEKCRFKTWKTKEAIMLLHHSMGNIKTTNMDTIVQAA